MLNNVNLIGRIANDLEIRETNSGVKVLSFSVACRRSFSKNNAERETDFFKVVTWSNTAEFVNTYFKKGEFIAINGRLETRKYDKDGQTNTVTEIIANNVYFCGGKSTSAGESAKVEQKEYEITSDDDLPF